MGKADSNGVLQRVAGRGGVVVFVIVALLMGGCTAEEQTAEEQTAEEQQAFSTPEDAVTALVDALRPELDRRRAEEIFGPGINEALESGDDVADQAERAQFLEKYDQGHRLVAKDDGSRVLEIGDDDWPFAFPLIQRDGGWMFDTGVGLDELLSRRIGANELDTIQTCLAGVDAQREYAILDVDGDGVHVYAEKFRSDPGERNGLYWPTTDGEPLSPLGEFIGVAAEEGYEAGDPYHGYRFKLLFGQGPGAQGGALDYRVKGKLIGGFGLLAWPAGYGTSGIMSFITNHDGVVYEKDLGDDTDKAARSIDLFDPAGWEPVAIGDPE